MYAQHIQTPSYELNPLWQAAVAKLRWLNWRHFLLTVLVGAGVIYVFESPYVSDSEADLFFGCILTVLGVINGRHIANLAVFFYVRRHPGQLQGQVTMSQELSLWISLCHAAPVLLPIGLLLMPVPTPFVVFAQSSTSLTATVRMVPAVRILSAVAGVIAYILIHLVWLRWNRSRQARSKAAAPAA